MLRFMSAATSYIRVRVPLREWFYVVGKLPKRESAAGYPDKQFQTRLRSVGSVVGRGR